MADYKVKKKTTTYNENYPYSPSASSSVIRLSKQDYSYLIQNGIVDVWIHDPNVPERILGRGEYYPAVEGYSVTISRWPMSSFFIVSSSQDLGAEMIGTGRLTITVSPDEAPDGYTKFVRQSRVEGYVDISDKEFWDTPV